jgi:magnesium-transporting ATPase (P-type)
LIYILLVAVVVTALLRYWIDSGVILGVVVINAMIGFVQEGKAEQALQGLRKLLSLDAQVRRDGRWARVGAEDLVPGDVVRLQTGDRVPADLRLLETTNLRVEESALTGESLPTEKDPGPVEVGAGVGDRTSMAFSGSLVAAGRGPAWSPDRQRHRDRSDQHDDRRGPDPGHSAHQADEPVRPPALGGDRGAGVGAVPDRLVRAGIRVGEVTLASIGFAVAAIPEGLPAILTITLAVGVQRMAGRNAITRRLHAVETLGSVTVICSDKTGTSP